MCWECALRLELNNDRYQNSHIACQTMLVTHLLYLLGLLAAHKAADAVAHLPAVASLLELHASTILLKKERISMTGQIRTSA